MAIFHVNSQPERRAQRRIGCNQRNAGKQCAGGADIFTEPRLALSHDIQHGQRQNNDKADQNHIFQIFEHTVARQAAQLFGKGNLVQQILHKPKRAQPAANQPTEQRAEQQQKTDHIKGEFVCAAGDDSLK